MSRELEVKGAKPHKCQPCEPTRKPYETKNENMKNSPGEFSRSRAMQEGVSFSRPPPLCLLDGIRPSQALYP